MTIESNYSTAFVAALALREKQIQQNYRPIIAVHKWFARRPGTLFRALALAEFGEKRVDATYYESQCFQGKTVGDPFMGGGIPILEANRAGCNVVGIDINPMSAWIVREELAAIDLQEYSRATEALTLELQKQVGDLYRTRCPITGKPDADVKYFLWVKTGNCRKCCEPFDLFPGYVIAEDSRHTSYVLVCPDCGDLNEVADPERAARCACGAQLSARGRVSRNKATCPNCGHVNGAPFHDGVPPKHRLVAIEYFNEDLRDRPGRLFKKPDAEDLARVARADRQWSQLKSTFVPDDEISAGDESSRLHKWGYRRFRELFNVRQLLGLETGARLISKCASERIRRALATNFSDLLRYQNMLCRYDTMALKSLDVFSIHGFPVGYVQVESNMLGIRNSRGAPVGSGGWVNIIDKYWKAKRYCTAPFEIAFEGKKKLIVPMKNEFIGETNPEHPDAPARVIDIRCGSATAMELKGNSLDAVFTDPPYYGNVQYGELMEFCYVWLRKLMGADFDGLEAPSARHCDELTGNDTAERDLVHFTEGLAAAYRRIAAALKPGAPLAFTYHHNKQEAYCAAGVAILDAGLTCSASLACPAEMGGSIHIHGTKSSIVDTVFVCRASGYTPRALLFEDSAELAVLMRAELEQLRAAGMKPSEGDIRCIALGHLTRMAIWNLRLLWDDKLITEVKLHLFSDAMNSIGPVNEVCTLLARRGNESAPKDTGVNAFGDADAIAF